MKLTDKVYDGLNFVNQLLIPGLSTLYFALSGIWGLPNTEKVVGSLAALNVFMGAIQAWIKKNYEPEAHGTVLVDNSDPDAKGLKFQLNVPLEHVTPGKNFLLNVKDEHPPLPAAPQQLHG